MASYNALDSAEYNPYDESPMTAGVVTAPDRGKKAGISNWIKIGLPVAIIVIVGAVVGGVLGSRANKNNNSSSSTGGGSDGDHAGSSPASSATDIKNQIGTFPTATNSKFMVPVYPTTTNAAFTTPTFSPPSASVQSWPEDPFKPSKPNVLSVRKDRPRLIAPAYMWAALPDLIKSDPYLKAWNDTIFGNATEYFSQEPVRYFMDGPSGILDNAREIKQRIKAFAYVFRLTNDTKWVDRTWRELQNAAGKGDRPFGDGATRWNPNHFLDTAEFSAAFAIAYDWLYDMWSDDQKAEIRNDLLTLGLNFGVDAYNGAPFGWWKDNVRGNWNCVSNGGITMGALAILGDDTTGTATRILGLTIENAKANCAMAPSTDGTWQETANYWYFGTTGHAEMASSLITATGSDYGLLRANKNFEKTGDYHMYAYGPTSLFDWGDHGPNKFSTTANSMIFYAREYNRPEFALFQRDRSDAAEPWSMFWYDPSISGAYWNGLALDAFFNDDLDQWVSMRSSWTDSKALYVGMKAGKNQGHANHNDLDVGDFVLDALGTRWAGEFGSADYNSPEYFNSDEQDATRWKYYRKMTEGQNTILINRANQLAGASPKILETGSSGTKQGSSPVLEVPNDSTVFWVADMTSAYAGATAVRRGLRLLNARKQVLIQDEINTSGDIQWRMHTNATVTIDSPTAATLTLDGQTLKISILSPASGATFSTSRAVRFDSDPPPAAPDQPNTGITVLIISLDGGDHSLQVLFNPEWNDGTNFVTPPSVDLADWTLTSHNS